MSKFSPIPQAVTAFKHQLRVASIARLEEMETACWDNYEAATAESESGIAVDPEAYIDKAFLPRTQFSNNAAAATFVFDVIEWQLDAITAEKARRNG